ncbi:MAG TPA: helix-turn-helix domain-containing protein [Pyrinomonadaceae bacterium]|nr:helix-turn-helix domain-containing protein [Pyrinomonadaceae bacterium]
MNGLQHNSSSHAAPIISTDGCSSSSLVDLPQVHLTYPAIADARVASLKVLVFTLLSEIESLENRLENPDASAFSLQEEVHRFEAALIRAALSKTGGRQRRAARLLGTKVTTLNTKIKRYGIS